MDPCGNWGMRRKHRPSPPGETSGRRIPLRGGKEHRRARWAGARACSVQRSPNRGSLHGHQEVRARTQGSHWGATLTCPPPFLRQGHQGAPRGGFPHCWVTGFEFLFQHASWSYPDQLSFLNHLESTLIRKVKPSGDYFSSIKGYSFIMCLYLTYRIYLCLDIFMGWNYILFTFSFYVWFELLKLIHNFYHIK